MRNPSLNTLYIGQVQGLRMILLHVSSCFVPMIFRIVHSEIELRDIEWRTMAALIDYAYMG